MQPSSSRRFATPGWRVLAAPLLLLAFLAFGEDTRVGRLFGFTK